MKDHLQRLKRNPLGLVVWIACVCGCYMLLFADVYKAQYTVPQRLPWVICALLCVLIGHEVMHALAAKLLCGGNVRIEIAKDPMGIPSLRTVFPNHVSKARQLVIYLAPLVVLTVLPTVIIACVKPVFVFFIIAMINGVGAYFDLIDVALLLSDN